MPDRKSDDFSINAYGIDPWLAASTDMASSSIHNSLQQLSRIRPDAPTAAWPIGLEIGIQEKSFNGEPAKGGCCKLLEDFGVAYRPLQLVRPLRTRAASELAAYYLFRNCSELTPASLCKANALLGGSGIIRTHKHQTSKYASGHRSVFLPPERVAMEMDHLLYQINGGSQLDPFRFAVAGMLHLLGIHPFSDANGRLSCLLFQYLLFKHRVISFPLLPLGPFLEKNRAEWLHALLTFNLRHTLDGVYDMLARGVKETTGAVERALKN